MDGPRLPPDLLQQRMLPEEADRAHGAGVWTRHRRGVEPRHRQLRDVAKRVQRQSPGFSEEPVQVHPVLVALHGRGAAGHSRGIRQAHPGECITSNPHPNAIARKR